MRYTCVLKSGVAVQHNLIEPCSTEGMSKEDVSVYTHLVGDELEAYLAGGGDSLIQHWNKHGKAYSLDKPGEVLYWQDLVQQAIDHIDSGVQHVPDGQPLRIGPDLNESQEDDWAGWTKPKGASDV